MESVRGLSLGCLATLLLAACSTTHPLGSAPGVCGQAREFAFVGESTLAALGFERLEQDPDFRRRGRFWVTAEALPIPIPNDALGPIPLARRALERHERMLCVEWLDGRQDIGMRAMSVPGDWVP